MSNGSNDTNSTALVKQLWFSSNQIFRRLDAGLGAVHGIGFTEYMILDALMQGPYQIMRRVDLADAVGRTASGITRILGPMEKIGLIEKAQNARDARVSLVKLTDNGKRIWHEASASFEQKCASMFDGWDDGQIESFGSLLRDAQGRK